MPEKTGQAVRLCELDTFCTLLHVCVYVYVLFSRVFFAARFAYGTDGALSRQDMLAV